MLDPVKARTMPIDEVFARYHVGWETKNPDLIASLHSKDTVFQLHDGSPAVHGRDALRVSCVELFKQFDFDFEVGRFFHGADHWVLEWTMVLKLVDSERSPIRAGVEMLDLVTIDADQLVARKDVYMNGGQASAARQRAFVEP